jgi:hypothetical protein
LVVLGGVIVVSSSLAGLPLGHPAVRRAATQVLRAVAFGLLTYFGYRQRHNPPAHKRLMVIATIALMMDRARAGIDVTCSRTPA